MNLSFFDLFLGNQRSLYVISQQKQKIIQEMGYFINEKYTKSPLYQGKITENDFSLIKTRKMLQIPLDFSYRVLGKFQEKEEECIINYKVTYSNYFLKHSALCIIPTILLIYIFSHYSSIYLLIPLLYYFTIDFFFNIGKHFYNKQNSDHFKRFLIKLESNLQYPDRSD